MSVVRRLAFVAMSVIAIGVLAIVIDMAIPEIRTVVTPTVSGSNWEPVANTIATVRWLFVPTLLFAVVAYAIWGGVEEERREEARRVRPP